MENREQEEESAPGAIWNAIWSAMQAGESVRRGNMQLFGLRHRMLPAIDYLTLERAFQAGNGMAFRVDEVSEGGSVTQLKVHNGLNSPVLLVEGEILLGAKQNRTVYTTILVDRESDITIPVACVEQGRWSRRPAARFALSEQYAHSSLRYAKLSSVAGARTSGAAAPRAGRGFYPVDQVGVWSHVAAFQDGHGAHSPTGSADEAYRTARERVVERLEFACPRDCCGIAVAIDGRLAGIESFDRPDTLERMFPRLIQSYINEAMLREALRTAGKTAGAPPAGGGIAEAEADEGGLLSPAAIASFLGELAGTRPTCAPGVGLGEDLRAGSSGWSAAALTYGGSLLHAQALMSCDA
jgi:hypothetical protein